MMLARKNLLGHIDGSKPPPANDAAALLEWKASDMKAFAILATMLSQQYQTMIRTAGTANHKQISWMEMTVSSTFIRIIAAMLLL